MKNPALIKIIIQKLGGQDCLAQLVGIRQPGISKWIKRGIIPAEHVLKIYELLNGEIPLYEINPKIYPRHIFNK